jgi:hypothetical protein
VSLDLLAGLAGLQDNCICLTNTLNDLQQGLGTTRQVRRGSNARERAFHTGWKEAEKPPLLALAGVELPPMGRRLVPINH